MAVNLDKPHLWKQDTQASVDHYNKWFMKFAPKAFRETRIGVTEQVEKAIVDTEDLLGLTPDRLRSRPGILPTLRMSCCPPLAVDRLVGLAYTDKNLVKNMEKNRLAVRMAERDLTVPSEKHCQGHQGIARPGYFRLDRRQQEAHAGREASGVDHRCRQADRSRRESHHQERARETPAPRD